MSKWMGLLCLFFAVTSYAASDEQFNFNIHQVYITPRSLAAGGSFSVIDDYNVLLYNPAGLARLKEGELNFGFYGAVTDSALGFYKDIDNASKAANQQQAIDDVLTKNYGKTFGVRVPALSAFWARPKWGLGVVLADWSTNLEVHKVGTPQIAASVLIDNTIAFGYAKGFLEDDALTAGVTAKAIYRGYVGKSFNALDLAGGTNFFKSEDAKEALTIDFDLGTQYVLAVPESGFFKFLKYAKPTFSFVIRNVLDYGFQQNFHLLDKNSAKDAPKLGRRFDVGTKWELPHFWVFSPRFMLDVRDIGHRHWTFLKGLHTGVELAWDAMSWLKGAYSMGLSQGYFTAGIAAQLAWFRLEGVTYGEEMGTSKAKRENRYYLARLSLDF